MRTIVLVVQLALTDIRTSVRVGGGASVKT